MKLPRLLLGCLGLVAPVLGEAQVAPCAPAEILVRWTPGKAKATAAGLQALEAVQRRYGLVEEVALLPDRSTARAKPAAAQDLALWSRLRFDTREDPRRIAQAYASLELVAQVQPNYLRRLAWIPSDSLYPQQWNLPAMGWEQAGPLSAEPVVVGLIDSGVDFDHPDIASRVWYNQAEVQGQPGVDDDGNGYVDDFRGWDFADAPGYPGEGDYLEPDNEPWDETGHGTHVAGIIAASTDNARGIAGVAPGARTMVLRAGFNLGGGGYLQDDDIAAAMVYAADNGARVLNLSFGDPRFSPLLQEVASYARQAGCVLVGAAGNEGQSPVFYPAGFAEVIAVAASGPDGQILSFSNWGYDLDLAAPGYEILSLAPGGGYARLSGTSMAAAQVSGLAALVLARHPQFDPEQVRAALLLAARDVAPAGWDERAGAGIGQVAALGLDQVPGLRFAVPRPGQVLADSGLVEVELTGVEGEGVELSWGAGEEPASWILLARDQAGEGRPLRTTWNTAGLAGGTYLLRARLAWSGRSVEERVAVRVEHRGPVVAHWRVHPALDGPAWAFLAEWDTDIPAAGTLRLFRAGEQAPLYEVLAPPQRRQHRVQLPGGLPAGEYRVALESTAGDLAAAVAETLDLRVEGRSVSRWSMRELAALPDGYLLPSLSDFDGDSRPEVAQMAGSGNQYNPVDFYEYAAGVFHRVYTTALLFIPWSLCDLDGDGRVELLGVDAQRVRLLEPETAGAFPGRVVWQQQDAWGGEAADLDRDGRPELFLRSGQGDVLRVFESRGDDALAEVAALANPTQGVNSLTERLVLADLDGDGQGEVLAGDEDGDLFAYESVADDAFRPSWQERGQPLEQARVLGGGRDLDGDGRSEFVAARLVQDPFDLSQTHWRAGVYQARGDNDFAAEWEVEVLSGKPGGNGAAVGDLDGDGRPEFVLALVPNLYVFKAVAPDQYEVVWQSPAGDTHQPLIGDLDGDGQAELLFSSGGQIQAWTRERPPGGLEAPAGLTVAGLIQGRVVLEWEAVPGAVVYRVYRGQDALDLVGQVVQSRFEDSEAGGCPGCRYAVAGVDSAGQEGLRSTPVQVGREDPPRVVSVERLSPGQLGILFSVPMRVSYLETYRYRVEPGVGVPASVVLDRGGQRVVLGFEPSLPDSGHFLLVLDELRSAVGTPLEPASRQVALDLVPFQDLARLLEGRALSATRILLRFSQPVVLGEDPARSFSGADGALAVAAVRLGDDPREVVLELDPHTPLEPLGRAYRIQVRGLQDRVGRRVGGEVLVRFAAPELDAVRVFPNPFRPSRGRLTFGALPAQAQVRIFDLNGRMVQSLREEDGDGGVEWDGLEQSGEPAPSGVFFYQARSDGRVRQGRFALIRE